MSFTLPVGNFIPTTVTYRPNSVADNVTGGGTIANSSNAFDGNSSSFGRWTASGGGPVSLSCFSIFTFVGATILNGKNLYVSQINSSNYITITFYMSIDGGTNYIYSFTIPIKGLKPTDPVFAIPNGTVLGSLRFKINLNNNPPLPGGSEDIYDIVIQ